MVGTEKMRGAFAYLLLDMKAFIQRREARRKGGKENLWA